MALAAYWDTDKEIQRLESTNWADNSFERMTQRSIYLDRCKQRREYLFTNLPGPLQAEILATRLSEE